MLKEIEVSNEAFPTADVIAITTGRLAREISLDGVCQIESYMFGVDCLSSSQIQAATSICKEAILNMYPQLSDFKVGTCFWMYKDMDTAEAAWLSAAKKNFGETIVVKLLPEEVRNSLFLDYSN